MTKVWVKGQVSTEGFAQCLEYIFQIKVLWSGHHKYYFVRKQY